jgi:chitin disaccharide deacetylase
MDATRHLLVIADDFGIGPETSRGILDLAVRGLVTGTVVLVNSPHAVRAVSEWRRAGEPAELGWHPCLTLDGPVSPPASVPSLVGMDGKFWPLGTFLRRLFKGRIRRDDIRTELLAQFRRFVDLAGRPPALVNTHQHVALFSPVGQVLRELFVDSPRPVYCRAVREPWHLLRSVGGARWKRAALNLAGRWQAGRFEQAGFLGADWLVGLSNPLDAVHPEYFTRWLLHAPGQAVELMCHPGHSDPTLGGRDGTPAGGSQPWRTEEFRRLADPEFAAACARVGFRRVRPSEWLDRRRRGLTHAA